MPLLLVFALIAACLPIDWPKPPFDPPRQVALSLTGSAVALVLLIAFVLRTWVIRTLRRDPNRRIEIAHIYGQGRRILFFVNMGTAIACVLGLGWGWLIQREFLVSWNDGYEIAPFAELLVPLPYFVILLGCWLIYYDAEHALHDALHYGSRPFWPRRAYLLHNFRQFFLMVMLPVLLLVTQWTLSRFAPETMRSDTSRIAMFAAVPVLLLLMPLALKPLLGLQSMPSGPVRARLESLAKRLNFRCRDFLLWPTHGAAANALIAGLLSRVRYVVFTDRILEELPPDELDAVFGHEIGHAKHGHIWLYAAFLTLSLTVIAAFGLFFKEQIVKAESALKTWILLPLLAVVASYLFVVFGALSRRCERQADVFGCKAVSCSDPECSGHDEKTVFPQGGSCLCPTGIRTFARALERVHDLNGLTNHPERPRSFGELLRIVSAWFRHWQHGPIPHRVAYVSSLIGNPKSERRFQWRIFIFKWCLMLTLLAALVALGEAVGWRDLFDAM